MPIRERLHVLLLLFVSTTVALQPRKVAFVAQPGLFHLVDQEFQGWPMRGQNAQRHFYGTLLSLIATIVTLTVVAFQTLAAPHNVSHLRTVEHSCQTTRLRMYVGSLALQ